MGLITTGSVSEGVNESAINLRNFIRGSLLQRIIIIDAIIIIFLNPSSLKWISELKWISDISGVKLTIPDPYNYILWSLVILLFIIAVIIRYRELSIYPPPLPPPADSSPIKGPLSFQQSDAELFKRLERNNEIQLYRNALLQGSYRFGVLTAVSGCGKSSLLNAGLAPSVRNTGLNCVIVVFTNKPPLESICESVTEQLNISGLNANSRLYLLLTDVLTKSGKPSLLLIFDQFEQFFTQIPLAEDRQPFIKELQEVFNKLPSIKILISIRSDFLNYLHEIQEKLGYTLDTARNYFTLRKFTVQQAVAIFMVIAEAENIENKDVGFLQKISKEELASKDDGLISPVDIQIIALVIKNNKEINTAFNESSFSLLGGIEGLLRKYIEDQLNAPNLFKKEDALGLLVSLIDVNKNVRAGQLTEDEIKEKMGSVSNNDASRILVWLENIRLIHKMGTHPARYELAHELLIAPLLYIVNDTNIGIRKANSLLENRTNEWLRNDRNSRYLFGWKELLLIKRYKQLISWGRNEDSKRELVKTSQNNFRNWGIAFSSLFILVVIIFIIWQSQWYQLNYSLKHDILDAINNTFTPSLIDEEFYPERDYKNIAIDSLATIDCTLALQTAENIIYPYFKYAAYIQIAAKVSDKKKADSVLILALQIAKDSISEPSEKAFAFSSIAAKMSDKKKADSVFTLALQTAKDMKLNSGKFYAYGDIAAKMSDRNPLLALQIADSEIIDFQFRQQICDTIFNGIEKNLTCSNEKETKKLKLQLLNNETKYNETLEIKELLFQKINLYKTAYRMISQLNNSSYKKALLYIDLYKNWKIYKQETSKAQ